ncbi:MAG: phosphate signaling complex protein PhoU [Alphaproteobacteria bacterium]|nr:phosphate signaling complex protein PhoU [Alphaproteobacteria bacterium]
MNTKDHNNNSHSHKAYGKHIVSAYDADISTLRNLLDEMSSLVSEQLQSTEIALQSLDKTLANTVRVRDREVNELLRQVESHSLEIIARRQPMAIDLRYMVLSVRVAAEMERLGDHARNVAKRVRVMAEDTDLKSTASFKTLGPMLGAQLHAISPRLTEVFAAWRERDDERALKIRASDELIDRAYEAFYRTAATYMIEDIRHITAVVQMMFIAKHIERMGDKIADIAEHTYLLVHGTFIEDEE